MKSNNKTFNFVAQFKYLILIPAILALVAIVIGAIFNFNLDYDFQKVSNFNVKFNTTVTDCEYDKLESALNSIVEENGFDDFRIERIGEGAQNGLIVKVPNNDGTLDSKLDSLKNVIEENLLSKTNDIESSVVVSTSDLTYSLPRNISKMFWLSMLAFACVVVFVIAYNWIRFNLIAGLSLATSLAIEVAMLVSCLVLFRIPVNYNFVVPFAVMIVTTIINSLLFNISIKGGLNVESKSKLTNVDRVLSATKVNIKFIAIYMIALLVGVLGIVFFGNQSLIYLALAIIISLFVSAFISIFINSSLWSLWYKKDKDKVLTRRIQAEKKRIEAKNNKNKQTDEKIVV